MDESPPTISPNGPAPHAATMSLAARLMNVFAAPGEVFDSIKGTPHSVANWLVPAVLILVIALVGSALIFSHDGINHQVGEMIDKQMEQAGAKGPQAGAGRSIGILSTKISVVVGPAIGAFIVPFWTGLILWLVGAKILKGNFGYLKAVEAGGLANMIGVLDAIVKTLLILVLGNLFASPSLALLVKDFNPQNPAHAAIALVNVMLLWSLLVQSIALARLSGRSLAVAAAWLFGITAIIAGLFMGLGFAIQAAFKH
jgi:hypothetical protein